MMSFEETTLWKRTLGGQAKTDATADSRGRERLRLSLLRFRERAEILAAEIPITLRTLTVHDIKHIDALWETASLIAGPDYEINPAEAFILGGAFLLHDLGHALAAFPRGLDELKLEVEWKDALSRNMKRELHRSPTKAELNNPSPDIEKAATEESIRAIHARVAIRLAEMSFEHRGEAYFLLEDAELRLNYARLIGEIAFSHWWPISQLPVKLSTRIGAFPGFPVEWTIDPLKLACLLRVADGCQIDKRRAPDFLRALRKPSEVAAKHWNFQNYIQTPHVEEHRLAFTSVKPFPVVDSDAWWLGYDMIAAVDQEMREADSVLLEHGRPRFAVTAIVGAGSPRELSRRIATDGWIPVDTRLRVTDVGSIVQRFGGAGLYGSNPVIPLRELIQNARDAVVARRIYEERSESWGEISIRMGKGAGKSWIEVDDTGIGMSKEVLSGPFLDFGTSYWDTSLAGTELPGLLAKGFNPTGRFGIGFYSVFMWGEKIRVTSRRPDVGRDETLVLEFQDGLRQRPLLRSATPTERRNEPGTSVWVEFDSSPTQPGGLLGKGHFRLFQHDVSIPRPDGWTLPELCSWLCPALDVSLYVDGSPERVVVVSAHEWKSISNEELMHRLHRFQPASQHLFGTDKFKSVVSNLRTIKDSDGNVYGRACVMPMHLLMDQPSSMSFELQNELRRFDVGALITDGPFRSMSTFGLSGMLIGHARESPRSGATPVMAASEELAEWASAQADLVKTLACTRDWQAECAGLIRRLGGCTRDLPIVKIRDESMSFDQVAALRDLPDEVLLYQEHWGIGNWDESTPLEGVIGVCSGRMRRMWYGDSGDNRIADPQRRAAHRQWDRFWMSLWGAAIEAIARSWGESLQSVLEVSSFSTKENPIMRDACTSARGEVLTMDVEVIRRPSSK